jgi:hypothetical protein
MLTIMANRAYRFPNPGASLVGDGVTQKNTQNFHEAYAEVHPGATSDTFGNPVQVPEWVRRDKMFQMALKDKNIVVLSDEPLIVPSSEQASRVATLTAAAEQERQRAQAEAAKASAPSPIPVDLDSMTKAELVEHAAGVHGLSLDPNLKKSDLIASIKEADESKPSE